MKNKEFYQETFEQVHPVGEIRWEEMKWKPTRRRLKRKIAILAAVICLLVVAVTLVLRSRVKAEARDYDLTV